MIELPAPETAPVLPRAVDALPGELPRGAEIPADHDPLADGILMAHQRAWLDDHADLKLCEKGRRTGITYAEALDDTLIAAASRAAGGDNVFYIGDTKDKGREFIGYVAHFARVVAQELIEIEEFVFKDQREDGTSRDISAYRAAFASGFRVEALSSRPENIRGLQGVVVIDEAAFHKDVRSVLDAVNALLIWGGKIRVISTHNGTLNPFNELVREARAGKVPFNVHFIPFAAAVENGLFRRVCLMRGKEWSLEAQAAWEAKIRGAYGARTAQMQQELDAIPADGEGAALPRVVIERAAISGGRVIRLHLPDSFKEAEPAAATRQIADWCLTTLTPVLTALDPRLRHDFGWDFARSGDASAMVVSQTGPDLVRRWPLVLELRNVPFEAQRDILYFVGARLPRLGHGAFDATGNGAYLAEKGRQKWGERVSEIKLSTEWYRQNGTPYVEAFGDRTVEIVADEDIVRDHQALQYVGGVVKVPDDMRFKGSDGLVRHGDTGIAGMLAWFASRQDGTLYEYTAAVPKADSPWSGAPEIPDSQFRDPYRAPLGARVRGGGI